MAKLTAQYDAGGLCDRPAAATDDHIIGDCREPGRCRQDLRLHRDPGQPPVRAIVTPDPTSDENRDGLQARCKAGDRSVAALSCRSAAFAGDPTTAIHRGQDMRALFSAGSTRP